MSDSDREPGLSDSHQNRDESDLGEREELDSGELENGESRKSRELQDSRDTRERGRERDRDRDSRDMRERDRDRESSIGERSSRPLFVGNLDNHVYPAHLVKLFEQIGKKVVKTGAHLHCFHSSYQFFARPYYSTSLLSSTFGLFYLTTAVASFLFFVLQI